MSKLAIFGEYITIIILLFANTLRSSFLPQDRVSEFAQMSPQQLLKETQRTAGDENLMLWHTTLIEKGKELKVAQTVNRTSPLWLIIQLIRRGFQVVHDECKHVSRLQEKQQALERDVHRYRERRAIETNVGLV
jgi:structural maintenance of chromosomes protein 5